MKRKFKHGELSSGINIGGKFGNKWGSNVNLGSAVVCMSYKNLELKLDICISIQIASVYSNRVSWYFNVSLFLFKRHYYACGHEEIFEQMVPFLTEILCRYQSCQHIFIN